jgi:hypothetical protein
MPLEPYDVRSLAEAWIEDAHKKRGSRDASFAAFEQLWDLIQCEPEDAWRVIGAIRQMDGSDSVLANLAAGPVESLLAKHGDSFIDRIETLARRDPQFRKLLGAVWRNRISEKVWARMKAVAGPSF